MKHFVKKITLFFLIILVIVASINYFIDPGSIFFNKNSYKKISFGILSNKYVTYSGDFNERLLQKEIIENKDSLPEIIVLGSSRIMQIDKSSVNNSSFFNNGVSGCTIEDLAAILNLYQKKFNCIPKNIILGLDPWILNSNSGEVRYKSIQKNYMSFFEYQYKNESTIDYFKFYQLFSGSYLLSSLKSLIKFQSKIIISDNKINGLSLRLPDGSIQYPDSYYYPTEDEKTKLINNNLRGPIYAIENFNYINRKKLYELNKLFLFLKKNNCNVKIYLSPYHPKAYSIISKNRKYENVIKSEVIFNKLAQNFNFEIYGSFNPDNLVLNNNDFLDAMHIRKEGVTRLINLKFN